MTMLAAALRYASAGWPVFPIKPADKVPLTGHGFKEATTDEATIHEWWGTYWPNANIGVATGVVFDVLDLDQPEALDGLAALAPADVVLEGPTVHTGKGYHLYFAPTGLGNRARVVDNIDWRGAGGYVLVPPSVHPSGALYTWHPNSKDSRSGWQAPLNAVPEWLRLALDPPKVERGPYTPWEPGTGDKYAQAALVAEQEKVATAGEGVRNHVLNEAAFALGQLVGAGALDRAEVMAALSAGAAICGLSGREVERTIESGLTAGEQQPRSMPNGR